jgi:cell division protein ZapA
MRMGMVEVTVNGRRQQLQCGDGEEPRLRRLASYVDSCAVRLSQQHGPMPDSKVLLLTSVPIADELADALEEVKRLKAGGAQTASRGEAEAAAAVQRVAERLERLAVALEQT